MNSGQNKLINHLAYADSDVKINSVRTFSVYLTTPNVIVYNLPRPAVPNKTSSYISIRQHLNYN